MTIVSIILSIFLFLGIITIFNISTGFDLIERNAKITIIIVPFFLFLIWIILTLTLGIRNKKSVYIIQNESFTLPDKDICLLPKEKIILSKTPCAITGISIISASRFPRHIIVTNFRITVGFLNSLSILSKGKMRERMGFMNIWHHAIREMPNPKTNNELMDAMAKTLGANTRIADIAYGVNRGGQFVIIRPEFWIPIYYTFYHPKADVIYDYFRVD